MKIIDFKVKGNMVKFYLGASDIEEWWGDDWDDRPYEHNAGTVYDKFVSGDRVMIFEWDDVVFEPSDGYCNSPYSKEDIINRKVPCICVLKKEDQDEHEIYWSFNQIIGNVNAVKYYFGDEMNPLDME